MHAHPHHHHHGHAEGNRAFAWGIGLNLGFVALEAGWGWHVGSLALLADAGHNLSDLAGLLLAWAAALIARRRPSPRHTYGWKRAGVVAALVNALLLLAAMAWLAWEAVQRLGSPQPVPGGAVMAVAALGILINGGTALLFWRSRHHDLNHRGAFWHMAADALVSAGVVVAGALTWWQGWTWVDPAVSLVIAVVIVAGTWGLLTESLHLLFDGVPAHVDAAQVRSFLAAQPGVQAVQDLHIWAMGAREVALTAHLIMPHGGGDDAFLHATAAALRERFGIDHTTLQVQRSASPRACDTPVPVVPACAAHAHGSTG
ncbi:Cadmium, cobalt and zinc/H(+)-K(+) antiporter [Tepidimonas alkaliphilus]|uniref:Cadmium, cobalt and zinc/H(+)-K(+) antiporter n=1 Tax=Tepidimonas alkaliphilus TaxID=2588942 RepID=A0A554W7C0_9BURK|nr:cation diffusion facilitator family transporter [Tepidimonas alkaliphilus]TSE19473.1 Cadmium, cobalt and zinc/H(+)-K(+) antiporter [Tepidimonas alkaliphilus]